MFLYMVLKACVPLLHPQEMYSSRANFYHLLQQVNQTSQVGKLYQQVCKLVREIVQGRAKPNRLTDMAKKRQVTQVKLYVTDVMHCTIYYKTKKKTIKM